MHKGLAPPWLPIVLNKDNGQPIQRQLVHEFKQAIVSVQLMPGQLLPSSRELAKLLGISRATAVRVYEDLTAQGYIETTEGVGTFVRKRLVTGSAHLEECNLPTSSYADSIMQLEPQRLTAHDYPELHYGSAPPEFLPFSAWKHAILESCRNLEPAAIEHGSDEFGYLPLREAICKYLSQQRLIDCSPDQLIVCSSSTYLLHLAAELMIDASDKVAFPEPGPIYARDVFNTLGAHLLPVPVDDNGIDVKTIAQLPEVPKVIYLNSTHNDPSGSCLSLERRKALAAWAKQHTTIIIEDEYEADYRYGGSPLPPIKALSEKDNVIYISNFWRTLYPLVNVSYMVAPRPLVPIMRQAWHLIQHAFQTHISFVDQQALTALLVGGSYEKHVHKLQSLFAQRWRSAVHELTRNFGSNVKLSKESCAYHIFMQLRGHNDSDVLHAAKEAGLNLLPASAYYMNPPSGVYLLPFAHADEASMAEKIRRFKEILTA